MRTAEAPIVVQRHKIPESIRSLDVLPCDYVDVFTATFSKAGETSPEQWARTALERSSAVGRFLAWQTILGLRLESGSSPDYLAGWKIVDRNDSWIRIEAKSWHMTANIIFRGDEDEVSFATLIRYDRPMARIVWTPVSAIHRRLAPDVLGAAVRRVSRNR